MGFFFRNYSENQTTLISGCALSTHLDDVGTKFFRLGMRVVYRLLKICPHRTRGWSVKFPLSAWAGKPIFFFGALGSPSDINWVVPPIFFILQRRRHILKRLSLLTQVNSSCHMPALTYLHALYWFSFLGESRLTQCFFPNPLLLYTRGIVLLTLWFSLITAIH